MGVELPSQCYTMSHTLFVPRKKVKERAEDIEMIRVRGREGVETDGDIYKEKKRDRTGTFEREKRRKREKARKIYKERKRKR